MADHRREQILDAVVAALANLTTTGTNIERGRVYAWDESVTAALSVFQGPDTPAEDEAQNWDLADYWLTVYVVAHAKTSAAQIDQQLNLIDQEVTVALQATPTLGLGFVIDLEEGEKDEPELSGEGNKPIASMRTTWRVKYRRSRTDPSA